MSENGNFYYFVKELRTNLLQLKVMVLLSLMKHQHSSKILKAQDNKNESNIGLMNQLFDGCGDKTSSAQLWQRYVPINSTSMCLGVQPQPIFKALTSIGKTVWMDSGFAERFLFTTVRPFRWIYCNPFPKYLA